MKHVRRSVFVSVAILLALPQLPVQEALVNEVVKRIPKTLDVQLGEIAYFKMTLTGQTRRPQPLRFVGPQVTQALAKVYPEVAESGRGPSGAAS